jgi:hypothetical protein
MVSVGLATRAELIAEDSYCCIPPGAATTFQVNE